MHSIPLIPLIVVLCWVSICGFAVYTILGKRRENRFHHEDSFIIGGILMLGLGACIALVVFVMPGGLSFWSGGVQILIALTLFAAAYRSHVHRLDPEGSSATTTYREKSATLVVATLLYVYLGYFASVWNETLEEAIPIFIGSVVLSVVIKILGHTGIAIFHTPHNDLDTPPDERDEAIEALSSRNAGYIVGLGFWIVPFMAVASVETFIVFNTWFAFLVLSEIVRNSSVVVYYRWGDI
jgi:drug/metabolite transporter (DMT)-like permease